jgi:hypothetical protein
MDTVKIPDEGRRSFLAASAAAGAVSLLPAQLATAAGDAAIHPFRVNVPEADLADLRKRIAATKWPEREQVADATQGVQLDTSCIWSNVPNGRDKTATVKRILQANPISWLPRQCGSRLGSTGPVGVQG